MFDCISAIVGTLIAYASMARACLLFCVAGTDLCWCTRYSFAAKSPKLPPCRASRTHVILRRLHALYDYRYQLPLIVE